MKTWFITGSSRGLGAALARHVVDRGDALVATARDRATVTEVFGPHERVHSVSLDVRDPADALRAVQEAVARFGRLDVVVNNAGVGMAGAVEEVSDDDARQLFDTNFFGVLNVIRAALPVLREQGSGRIVNIGSMSGLRGTAGVGLYNASKFALEGLTEALSKEVLVFGIQAMIVEVGATRTEFNGRVSIAKELSAYRGTPARELVDRMGRMHGKEMSDSAKVAALIYDAASSSEMPMHLPTGPDAVEAVERRPEPFEQPLVVWRDRAMSTVHN